MHCNTLQHTASLSYSQQHTYKSRTVTWEPSYTLQRTATHCNAMQRTATHCNALQRTATHCIALQRTATYCDIMQYTTTYSTRRRLTSNTVAAHHTWAQWLVHICTHYNCNTLQTHVAHCNTLQHNATQCEITYTVEHGNALQHTATHCNVL